MPSQAQVQNHIIEQLVEMRAAAPSYGFLGKQSDATGSWFLVVPFAQNRICRNLSWHD
jgi:hypothetical protein